MALCKRGWTYDSLHRITIPLMLSLLVLHCADAVDRNKQTCTSIDIRNTVDQFRKLENCTVIEGYLQISLIDNASEKDYENLTFPKLQEITGFLLLFRAFGLTSLERLFPNLAVIRGDNLIHHFALFIFEMFQLKEIGLGSLTNIIRGSVFIHKNPQLCYINTVDWERILSRDAPKSFIRDNHPLKSCLAQCPDHCKKGSHGSVGDSQCKLCWSSQTCQKICDEHCSIQKLTCSVNNTCCHKECLGGCKGPESSDCTVCRHYLVSPINMCRASCPNNTFLFMKRRCVEESVCKKFPGKVLGTEQQIHWKPLHGQCLAECPAGYIQSETDPHNCTKCTGQCPKVCPGVNVNSVAAAQTLHGCTRINGSLIIHVQGGSNMIAELEKNLDSIQEVSHFLKVYHSFPLISLSFLKNLTVIKGEQLDHKNYSFLVFDNQNLQEFWNWTTHPKLEIRKGKIFFHFNPKLCMSKIRELKNLSRLKDWEDLDVAAATNGDRAACDMAVLDTMILKLSSIMVIIEFSNFQLTLSDQRSLLGYIIFYRETKYENLTIFDGRDACGADLWKTIDVNPENSPRIVALIPHLKPFTLYAYYVRTFTIATVNSGSETKGAMSPILYFNTTADTPTAPLNVNVTSLNPVEIEMKWNPPRQPNGIVTYYQVIGEEVPDSQPYINQQDYCQAHGFPDVNKPEPLPPKEKTTLNKSVPSEPLSSQPASVDNDCCACVPKKPTAKNDNEEIMLIELEDLLHNFVYVKNTKTISSELLPRKTRSIGNSSSGQILNTEFPSTSSPTVLEASTINAENVPSTEPAPVLHTFSYKAKMVPLKIDGLKHFTQYTIAVAACIDRNPDPKKNNCSSSSIAAIRTSRLAGADDITSSLEISPGNYSSGSIFVKWREPQSPNGLIVLYHLEYESESDKFKFPTICVSQASYAKHKGHLVTKLGAGKYVLRIRATSLAGPGNWTEAAAFEIAADAYGSSYQAMSVIVTCVVLTVVIMAIPAVYYINKKFRPGVPDGILYASVNPEYMSAGLVYEPDNWEVPREKIKILHKLGLGSFGMVYEGEAKELHPGDSAIKCAVKTVNESASLREQIAFLQEASIMKAFKCHHVVKLLGVVSKGQPTLVIMELMANGDLKSYLRSHRPDETNNPDTQPPSLKEILQMSIEIADGMAYLAAKKYVHRDLAARNCMVAEDMTVKIGDFGMTRDIYETDYYRKGGKGLLPVRWMAPESLKDGVFDSQSDVWSFGVVLWEMSTLASQPYQGLSSEQVLKYVINGGMMECPENCPEKLYALMKLCWEKNPRARPTFCELIEILLPDVSDHFQAQSFYFTQRTKICPPDDEEGGAGMDGDGGSSNPTAAELATPTTPLKEACEDGNCSDDDESLRFFPSATVVPEENGCVNGHSSCGSSSVSRNPTITDNNRGLSINSNEGSKGMSLPSSDGSKGSKVSSVSNGSLANGHAYIPSVRTTKC